MALDSTIGARYPITQAQIELMTAYRNVFTKTKQGRDVFKHMLGELGLFDIVQDTEVERARQDYAKRLLLLCGIYAVDNAAAAIDAMLNMPIQIPKEAQDAGENIES